MDSEWLHSESIDILKERGIILILELLFSGALLIIFTYCHYYIGVTMPTSAPTELGPEQWPQLILKALIILMIVNMVKIYRGIPTEDRNFKEIKNVNISALIKNKLFIGIIFILLYAYLLEPAGFLLSTIVFIIAYARLIGEKRIKILVGSSFAMTFGLYFLFAKGLSIMLPRGYGILRSLALMLESI